MTQHQRAKKNAVAFTDLWLTDKVPYARKGKQELYWDKGAPGLSLLVGTGTKTFRSQFKLHGEWVTRKLGQHPKMGLAEARKLAGQDRDEALKGTDPREGDQAQQQKTDRLTFEAVVDSFITHYAKPRQRTWPETERTLKSNCRPWLKRPINEITKQDARTLLRGFIAEGHPYKANVTRAWLKKLWRWAYAEDLVKQPIMEAVSIDIEKRKRVRVYSDAEIQATWAAANKLDPAEAAFIKLIMLLAPRKTSLACVTKADLNDAATLWTVPFDLTKSRKTSDGERVYLIPLPPLCQRLFKGVIKDDMKPDDTLFPPITVYTTKGGQRKFDGKKLKAKLVALGAPADFKYHTWRDTIATFLQNAGHSKWERGLVLNHAESGVTADYSHGYPLELKLKLLTKWADYVEALIQPEGAALLR